MGLRRLVHLVLPALAALATLVAVPVWCGREAGAWYDGRPATVRALADELTAFEAEDTANREASTNRFAGEWALVTHQMIALGLAQLCAAHPDWLPAYGPTLRTAALRSFLPEMRGFGTEAWRGEDALSLAALQGEHGHAYMGYPALAVGMARLLTKEPLPPEVLAEHDALIAAYTRKLAASPTGLVDTYPGEAYPTDVAAVAAAIAVHGRATGTDTRAVIEHWAAAVRSQQVDPSSGLVYQRMSARTGEPHDVPRASGTGLAAYFAGFADRAVAEQLTAAMVAHERTLFGFSGVREYAEGHSGWGDVDSGPVVLGVSVSATGFALAPYRAFGHREPFERVFRTATLFGMPASTRNGTWFRTGGPIGNALLFAMMTSGPEVVP